MSKPFEGRADRDAMRTKIMGLGERAGRKSYYPQLQARIQELEEKSASLLRMLTERDDARRKAEESEKRFRELAELLPQTVFETDQQGRLTFANRFASAMFGYSSAELLGGMDCVALLAAEERGQAHMEMQKSLQGIDLPGRQWLARRKDGRKFPCIVYATVIRDGTGVRGLRGIVADLSEQVRLREQKDLIEARYQQAQKMEAVGRLAGGIAHDLNNLLSPILGYTEMLLDEFSTGDTRLRSLEEIHRAGSRARDMVRQLLAFSRKQSLDIKVSDLNRVIANFERLLRRMLRENIQIQLHLAPAISPIQADVGQIEQVLMNLAVNAQDAMPQGGRLYIETAMVDLEQGYSAEHHGLKPGRYILLAMSDTGHGMDYATRQRIFEPFFTTKEVGKGTGLGLATAYGIVKQHAGTIDVISNPGKGSTFKVYLPAAQGVSAAPELPEPHDFMTHGGGETVLLAEDNDAVRDLTVSILKRHGYKVLAAANGVQCLSLVANHAGPLDLLITDVVMPDMNGSDLYTQVSKRRPGIKVLFMSGYTQDVVVAQGVRDHGIDFIQKPFSVKGLIAKLQAVLKV